MKLCDYGCGEEANFLMNNGKSCCSQCVSECKGVRTKISQSLKRGYRQGRENVFKGKSWNKGLTKETDIRIAKASEKIRNQFLSGERHSSFKGKHHSEETKKKLSHNGGFKQGSSRGKRGWYKGYWCDSSWELAWVIYNLDHGIKFERNHQGFEYEFKGKKHKYYPDFILEDGTYVEIKAVWDDKNKSKTDQFTRRLLVIDKNSISKFIDYVISKYGKKFIKLYEDNLNKKYVCFDCGTEISRQSLRCNRCAGKLKKRKVIRPSKEELDDLVKKFPMTTVGQMFGVSDNAVRKWIKSYDKMS